MGKAIKIICLSLFIVAFGQMLAGGQAGVTETIFNRRFLPTIKPGMTYEQVVKLAGAQGLQVGENRKAAPPSVQYRWKGGKDSVLTVNFAGNKMTDATILAPNKHTYLIKSNREVIDLSR